MKKNYNENKLLKWKSLLIQLEKIDLPQALKKLGEAAPEGDWHENIEFEDAERQVYVIRAKINEVKKIINKITNG